MTGDPLHQAFWFASRAFGITAMNSTTPKHIATQPQVFKPLRMYVALATKKCELETAAMPK
jgi:hypothetical protein